MPLRLPHAVMAATVGLVSASASSDPPPCPKEVQYVLAATLQLSDTPLGRGNGNYSIGPGRMTLRFEGNDVKMLSYTMRESFTVRTTTVFWTTTVTTDASSRATPDGCSIAAEGTLAGRTIHWRTPVSGYRTDGTITCQGSFCGEFGAPPPGTSALRIGPAPQTFSDFHFSPDMKTFTMPRTAGQKSEMPKQSSAVAVSGREVQRACAAIKPCTK